MRGIPRRLHGPLKSVARAGRFSGQTQANLQGAEALFGRVKRLIRHRILERKFFRKNPAGAGCQYCRQDAPSRKNLCASRRDFFDPPARGGWKIFGVLRFYGWARRLPGRIAA
jgi:hypothetical protein